MRSAVRTYSGFCFPVLSQGAQGGTATGRPLKGMLKGFFKLNTQDCTLKGFNQVLFLPYRFEPSCECGLCLLLLAQETCAFLTSARIKCVAAAAAAEAAAEAAA